MLIQVLCRVNVIICFVVGMILNSLLIVLICKHRNAICDKSYKPIVLQICITDMLNLIVFTFYMPAYARADSYGIIYTLGFFNDVFENAPMFTHITFGTWYFFVFLFIFSPSVQFLYRYLILCRDWKPSYRLYTGLYSTLVLFLLSFTIISNANIIYVSRTSNALYRDYIFTGRPTNVDLLVVNRSPSDTLSAIVMLIIVAIPSSIVIICGIRIWMYVRQHFRVAPNTNQCLHTNQRLQRQVNYVLFLQGGMPVVGHLVGLCLNMFLNIKTEYMSFLPNFLTLVLLVVNPLLTMVLVDSYRRAVLKLFSSSSATVPITVNLSTSFEQNTRNVTFVDDRKN
ncbi:serpentine type 7TM GPCR chemoreceptor str domain-containing protein [Ditylenchus destructor]|uniref:Serpentine type 7TM GPCR chemoreceptor str domain-containing protein n=1 Tax=Ditylenchus destructor TaxID=166010 RepID=A0AAD4MU09_9BILA|nr:serpentine type 7TM GPCR chemoreceptor str domain-containing protein [Ditylenchus destructor]